MRTRRAASSWRCGKHQHGPNANPAGVATILESVAKITPQTAARMKHIVNAETLELETIQPQIDALAQYGFIPNRYPVTDVIWAPARSV